MLTSAAFGEAGSEVVIEERLYGQEVTLLSFSDGLTVRPMLPSQDHKRALDGDLGLNTGGMGAYAPVPACPAVMVEHGFSYYSVGRPAALAEESSARTLAKMKIKERA